MTAHHTRWVLATATIRFLGRFIRGLLAALVLAVLVAGLPWALAHFVGWPLPDHLPTWDELQAVLLAPMTPEFLIDVLACVLWLLWARFTFDVLAAIPDMVRAVPWPSTPRRGPLHAVAGVLVSAVVVSVLSSRTTASTTPAKITAAEFLARQGTPAATVLYSPTSRAILPTMSHTNPSAQSAGLTEIVRHPAHGVHDSLWRIAKRCLGDGTRWPEIWTLNKNTVQADGQVFTNPDLIHPGWELRLPVPPVSEPEPPVDEQPTPPDAPTTESPGHPDEQPPTQSPTAPPPTPTESAEPSHPAPNAPPGISTSTGAFVGIGVAALITIALMTVRLHRRRRYRPGVSEPDDPGRTPVVRALRIAHDTAMLSLDDDTSTAPAQSICHADLETRDRAKATALAVLPASDDTMLGVRDGQAVALNVARSRGLGLIGPGAHAAARALIVSMLAQPAADAQIVLPADDARILFGADLPARPSTRLRVVDNLTAALDVLEAELLTRARHADTPEPTPTPPGQGPLVLVASPTTDSTRRTQAIADNGSAFNVASILLGQWRAGGTIRVRDDGTVGATSPNLADQLSGTRLFTLPSTDAADLLALLSDADSVREPTTAEPEERPAPQPTNTDDKPPKDTAPGGDCEFVLADQAATREQQPERTITSSPTEDRPASSTPTEVRKRARTTDAPPLRFQVLGRLHLTHTETEPAVDVIDALAPRQREILVYLALHHDGCRRESLTTALWPDAPGDRPYNSFHATLSQLRRALRKAASEAAADLVINDDGHYRLDPSLVTVDLWRLRHALRIRRLAANQPQKMTALRQATELYRGDLAEAIATDWIDAPRESLRREVLDALSVMIHAVTDDPERMLVLLEQARGMDPYNEAIYRDIMRVQARLSRHDSIPRTLTLLTTALADLDERPAKDTIGLADLLRRSPANQQRSMRAS
jgi:DNA-binding SARP family transcriptional activator